MPAEDAGNAYIPNDNEINTMRRNKIQSAHEQGGEDPCSIWYLPFVDRRWMSDMLPWKCYPRV